MQGLIVSVLLINLLSPFYLTRSNNVCLYGFVYKDKVLHGIQEVVS
jgi:hypothetical protein